MTDRIQQIAHELGERARGPDGDHPTPRTIYVERDGLLFGEPEIQEPEHFSCFEHLCAWLEQRISDLRQEKHARYCARAAGRT